MEEEKKSPYENEVSQSSQSSYSVRGPMKLIKKQLKTEEIKKNKTEQYKGTNLGGLLQEGSSGEESVSLDIGSESAKPRNVHDLASEQCFSETSENVMFVYKQFAQHQA